MGRSVSRHKNAVEVVYMGFQEEDDEDWFSDLLYDLRSILKERYKSFENCDRWAGREDHVILQNGRGEVSVSEYCGLVAVCLAPRDEDAPLDWSWCDQVRAGFRKVLEEGYPNSTLLPMGYGSNGEQFFTPKGRPEGCVTSKEGTLW